MTTQLITIGFTSLLCALLALVVLFPLARRYGLVDKPSSRKLHLGEVPLIGGLSVFIGLCITWTLHGLFTLDYGIYFASAAVLVALCAYDDWKDLSAQIRLAAQVLLAVILMWGTGLYLQSFGDILGLGVWHLGVLGPLVTIGAVIAATNAYNMMDGIDGLLGSISIVTLTSLSILFVMAGTGFTHELLLAATIAAALVPYLLANLGLSPFRHKIFMGDAGSMFIGFSLVWLFILGTQPEEQAFRPVTVLWLIAVPLMDMKVIMLRRWRVGRPLMFPDREHLHHILMRAGFTAREALALITVVALLCAMAGIAGEWLAIPEWLMFIAFMALLIGYDWLIRQAWYHLAPLRRGRFESQWR